MLTHIAATAGRLYPLKSGCGPVANSALFRWLDKQGGPDAIARVVGARAVVPTGDYVGRAMRFVGDLDPKVSWVVDRVLRPGDTALDIGANLGLVSYRMSARVGPQGHVHAFEPQPRMQDYMRKTLDMNPGLPITVHPIGLGPVSDQLTLSVPPHNAGAATLMPNPYGTRPDTETVNVKVEPLDTYAAQAGISDVRMIKMDVEGFEAHVLQGARTFLTATPPAVILFEDNAQNALEGQSVAQTLLRELGYTIYALPRALLSVRLVPVSSKVKAHDFVAVSSLASQRLRRNLRLL